MVKRLGILIPTYNRPKELKEFIDSFIDQAKKYKIAIYVADQSTDKLTQKVISEIKKSYNQIHYKHFKANGYANNVKNVMSMGNPEYMWLFGDDDAIMNGAIQKIFEALKQDYDYLLINAETFSNDLKRKIKGRIIPEYQDIEYLEGEHEKALLTLKNTGYQGFMAQMIIRKSIADFELKKLDVNESDMDFIHTILFYRAIVGKKGKLIAQPLIKNRGGNWGYSSRIMDIYFVSWDKTHDMLKGDYSEDTLKKARERSLFNLVIPITINKITNNRNSIRDYNEYIANNVDIGRRDKEILLIGMLMPKFILKTAYESYKKIKGY